MMQRKSRGSGKVQASPTLHNRKKGRRKSRNYAESFIVSFLGSLFALMCCCFFVYSYIGNGGDPDLAPVTPVTDGVFQGKLRQEKKPAEVQKFHSNTPHLIPRLPILPVFPEIPHSSQLIDETLNGNPTITGIVAILHNFIEKFHKLNIKLAEAKSAPERIVHKVFELIQEELLPLDVAYRGKTIFPVREDESIFMSLASFREYLLKPTLVAAFSNAESPDKLFIGAVVQNCFGKVNDDGTIDTEGKPCRTGFVVTGKNKAGHDQTTVSDAPPDANGIEEFCTDPDYKKYCDSGQVRVMYVHEPEAVGPAMARYYASKLWGGETYFVQSDSHLQFAKHWDSKYIAEAKATSNYPKSVLSSYPPGFNDSGGKVQVVNESPGARLCSCEFSHSDIEQDIIRINVGSSYKGTETQPTQIPFIAAGFFFAHANFLRDVPFDPFLPWAFMGEEIALSVRAWTSGWDIYAPRKNLIAHQYRPGRMGLPKFWEGVNRLYRGSGASNNSLQGRTVQRVKNLIGYEESSLENLQGKKAAWILTEQQYYGMGSKRTLKKYMEWTGIDMENRKCPAIQWCNKGELE